MATKDTVVQELVVNTLTHKQFKAAQEAGTLSPYELYGTPDTSVRLPVLTPMWFDHITNDVSWLRADTFSWQSGDVYVAAYEHLAGDLEGAELKTETVAGIEIQYYEAKDKHKICLPDQEANVSTLYEQTGSADYYLLDTTNKQFKLPRKHKRKLIQAYNNGTTWYNLYSDGYVEQGGKLSGREITFPIEFAIVPTLVFGVYSNASSSTPQNVYSEITTTGFTGWRTRTNAGWDSEAEDWNGYWQASGYAAESAYASAGMQLEYYYVGNFEQDAVEQTAGINAEMFNGKLDIELGNATSLTKETVVGWGMPDYTRGFSISSDYVTEMDGYITFTAKPNSTSTPCALKVDDITVISKMTSYGSTQTQFKETVSVAKGSKITWTGNAASAVFYPAKGE